MEQLLQTVGLDSETVLVACVIARAVLQVLDVLDEKLPRLKIATKVLGTLLGGSKAR